jgi:pyruvate,orthophosphate dikinase
MRRLPRYLLIRKRQEKIEVAARDKWVYLPSEGNRNMKDLLGGKGANLSEMWNMGLPIPPFFVASTEGCVYYMKNRKMPPGLEKQVKEGLDFLSQNMGKTFGDESNPLLLSVRSGAKFSMPGMMDTVLNVGLNKKILDGLINKTGNEKFARDCYRRLLQMYGEVVLGVDKDSFDHSLDRKKKKYKVTQDPELPARALRELGDEYEKALKAANVQIPSDPFEQLMLGIEAVFKSWNTERAVAYRNVNRISHYLGTAVNCQAMAFGNIDENSGSGVMFTRNPSSGEKELYGELLFKAQGEEVVAGTRTPLRLKDLKSQKPELYEQLASLAKKLEKHYGDMQDMEFTFESGRLFILQTRNGKRTGPAAVRVASDMVDEKLITPIDAVRQVDPNLLVQCLLPNIKPGQNYKSKVLGKGLNASPGAASGQVIFSTQKVMELIAQAEKSKKHDLPRLILVRNETNPDDFPGMNASAGILTSQGGMTSHAAVVARQMGRPCVAGCSDAKVNEKKKVLEIGGKKFREEDMITIDGSEGLVIDGELELVRSPEPGKYFERVMDWADKFKRLGVRANADKEEEASLARKLGARGIGLCRTEHQFGGERKMMVAELILILMSENPTKEQLKRKSDLLDDLLVAQRKDFKGVLSAMDGLPTTIRLIDPPFHEFLPTEDEVKELRKNAKSKKERVQYNDMLTLRHEIHEANPMLGLRGCRLGILFPIINEIQVRAIFEAACDLKKKGKKPHPEIMIPLTMEIAELRFLEPVVRTTAEKVMKEKDIQVPYLFGTMIEIPRAALTANEIAETAEFFSFGTNDLTQTVWGLSRDDTANMLKEYVAKGIIPVDPFEVLDQKGVGGLMKFAIENSRKTRPKIKLGICGEHGGEPESVAFCHRIGLDYVSCSTYRVPGARLAAAQAALSDGK